LGESGHSASHVPGSAIINLTSTFAVVGGLRGGAYAAAKGGLTSLTQHIAAQYGAPGIRCNAVAPGATSAWVSANGCAL
jgi:NAD(P)-dependent dehydrogenase (short-subunit alcohol dehydrogenase family)